MKEGSREEVGGIEGGGSREGGGGGGGGQHDLDCVNVMLRGN